MTQTPRTDSTTRTAPKTPRLTRSQRAELLMATGGVHPTGRFGHYQVRGSTPGTAYRVEITDKSAFCACRDWQRGYERTGRMDAHCYHSMAAVLYRVAIKASVRPHVEVGPVPAGALVDDRGVPYCHDCGQDLVGGRCVGRDWAGRVA